MCTIYKSCLAHHLLIWILPSLWLKFPPYIWSLQPCQYVIQVVEIPPTPLTLSLHVIPCSDLWRRVPMWCCKSHPSDGPCLSAGWEGTGSHLMISAVIAYPPSLVSQPPDWKTLPPSTININYFVYTYHSIQCGVTCNSIKSLTLFPSNDVPALTVDDTGGK